MQINLNITYYLFLHKISYLIVSVKLAIICSIVKTSAKFMFLLKPQELVSNGMQFSHLCLTSVLGL